MPKNERVTIFGDMRGISPGEVDQFVRDTGNFIGGNYPSITPTERATQVLQECGAQVREGADRFWVLDRDPQQFLQGVQALKDAGAVDLSSNILPSITLVRLGSLQFDDHRDPATGIRVV